MTGDLVTRLLLNNTQFDNNIKKSTQQVQDFQRKGQNVSKIVNSSFSSMLGVASKFAGGLGLVVGGYEALNKTIASTQTTGDAFVKMQDQAKASVDAFFASIAMGNFSNFLSGLDNVIAKAGDLSVALDNLGTKTLFNNSEYSDLSARYQLEINAAKNRNISDKERNAHLQKAKGLMEDMVKLRQSLMASNKSASYVVLQAEAAKMGYLPNIKKDTWDYMLKDSNRGKVESSASNYRSWEERIQNSREFDHRIGNYIDTSETIQLRRQFDAYKKTAKGRYEQLANIFIEMADDEKSAVAQAIKMRETANNLAVDISSKQLEINNTEARINGSFNSGGKGGGNKGGKASIEQDLLTWDIDGWVNEEVKGLHNKFQRAVMNWEQIPIQPLTIIGEEDPDELPLPITQDNIDITNDYVASLNAVANAMTAVNTANVEGAAGWLSWAGSMMTATAIAIESIRKVVEAKTAEAAASGGAEAAKTPIVGWLMVGGAIASVLAAMSSIPKFAMGGVVPGASFSGDNVIARVNSGEMILNRSQQGRLFNLLNSGDGSARDSKIELELRGDKLYGVLRNYLSRTGKFS